MKILTFLCFILPLVNIKVDYLVFPYFSKILTKSLRKTASNRDGCYGDYYKLSRSKGIKVLSDDRYRTLEDTIKSRTFKEAKAEAIHLMEARKRYPNIPKCFGVKIIEIGGFYKVGIVMEHLGETMAIHLIAHEDERLELMKELRDKLANVGIDHGDLHCKNIMFHKNDWYIIDFSPSMITINPN
jgi:serine/threonine-protein kinase RIO1